MISDGSESEVISVARPQGMAEDDCLTIAEIAAKLKVGMSKVRGWIASGRLQAYNVGAGNKRPQFRVSLADLRTFLLTKRAKAGIPVSRRPYHRQETKQTSGIKQFV